MMDRLLVVYAARRALGALRTLRRDPERSRSGCRPVAHGATG